jgi:hypothetical protein
MLFTSIAEDRDGREVAAKRKLVRGEQRTGRDREILAAGGATKRSVPFGGGSTGFL